MTNLFHIACQQAIQRFISTILNSTGEFIIYWAFTHGFTHIENSKEAEDKTFTTLISDMGQFYTITLYFEKDKKKCRKITFIDSLKIIPFSVKEIAKSFNLSISKLEIDYNKPRPKNHILTKEEQDYITNDVKIVAQALNFLFKEKLTKMTQGSNALNNFKELIKKSKFEHYFPKLDYEIDKDLRKAYRRTDLPISIQNIKKKKWAKALCLT